MRVLLIICPTLFPAVLSHISTVGKIENLWLAGTLDKLAEEPLDEITSEKIAGFIAKRRQDGLQIASLNRELQVLRQMFHLAQEWGKLEKVPPRVRMLPESVVGSGS